MPDSSALSLHSPRTSRKCGSRWTRATTVSLNRRANAMGIYIFHRAQCLHAVLSFLPDVTGTKRIPIRCFKTAPIRFSIARECPSESASSSLQMTEAVVPTSFTNWRWVRPACRTAPCSVNASGYAGGNLSFSRWSQFSTTPAFSYEVSRNMKSSGKRTLFRFTCSFRRLVVTP